MENHYWIEQAYNMRHQGASEEDKQSFLEKLILEQNDGIRGVIVHVSTTLNEEVRANPTNRNEKLFDATEYVMNLSQEYLRKNPC